MIRLGLTQPPSLQLEGNTDLLIPVSEMPFSVRAMSGLIEHNVSYIGQALPLTESVLRAKAEFGKNSAAEIRYYLEQLGFEMGIAKHLPAAQKKLLASVKDKFEAKAAVCVVYKIDPKDAIKPVRFHVARMPVKPRKNARNIKGF